MKFLEKYLPLNIFLVLVGVVVVLAIVWYECEKKENVRWGRFYCLVRPGLSLVASLYVVYALIYVNFLYKKSLDVVVSAFGRPIESAEIEIFGESESDRVYTNKHGKAVVKFSKNMDSCKIVVDKKGYNKKTIVSCGGCLFVELVPLLNRMKFEVPGDNGHIYVRGLDSIRVKALFKDINENDYQILCKSDHLSVKFNDKNITDEVCFIDRDGDGKAVGFSYSVRYYKSLYGLDPIMISLDYLNKSYGREFVLYDKCDLSHNDSFKYTAYRKNLIKYDRDVVDLYFDEKNYSNTLWIPFYSLVNQPFSCSVNGFLYIGKVSVMFNIGECYRVLIGEEDGRSVKFQLNESGSFPAKWKTLVYRRLESKIADNSKVSMIMRYDPDLSDPMERKINLNIKLAYVPDFGDKLDDVVWRNIDASMPVLEILKNNDKYRLGIGGVLYARGITRAMRYWDIKVSNSKNLNI